MTPARGLDWKAILRKWGPPLVTVIMLASAIVYFQQSRLLDSLDLQHLRWEYAALLLAARLLFIASLGLPLARFASAFGVTLDFAEWFGLTASASLVNQLTPIAGGAMIRGGYLKLKHQLPFSRFAAFLAVTVVLSLLVNGAVGLLMMSWIILVRPSAPAWILAAAFAALVAGPLLGLSLPLPTARLPFGGRLARWVNFALEGWQNIRGNRRLFAEQTALAVATTLTQIVGLHVGLLALGQNPQFVDSLILGVAISAWRVIPTAGVGVQEIMGAIIASAIGVNPAAGMGSVLLSRAVTLVILFTLGVWYAHVLSKRLGQPLARAAEAVTPETPTSD